MKKARVDIEGANSRLGALPPRLSESVLHCLIGEHWSAPHVYTLVDVQTFAVVCKEWFAVLDEAMSRHALQSFVCDLAKPTRRRVLEMRRQLILRRAFVNDVTVLRAPDHGELTEALWRATLTHMPRLARLDLGKLSLPTRRLAEVINAVSTHCPHMQTLVLSVLVDWLDESGMTVVTDALLAAMQRWAKYGGLRSLQIRRDENPADFPSSYTFLEASIPYCPKIKAIGGAFLYDGGRRAPSQWFASLGMWEAFCRGCQSLERFDWRFVPFATEYFAIFGRSTQARLTRLIISAPVCWSWRDFLEVTDVSTRAAVEANGFGGRAVQPEAVLRACPNLTSLEVKWHARHPDNRTAPPWGSHMDPEIFGDDFFEAAAAHCKVLTAFSLKCSAPYSLAHTLHTLTGRALRAVAALPYLTTLTVEGGYFTGDDVFDLLMGHTPATTARRIFKLLLGNSSTDEGTSMAFYSTVTEFVQRLVDHDGPPLWAGSDVSVVLLNRRGIKVDDTWGDVYFRGLRDLVAKVKIKYPCVCFRSVLTKYDSASHRFETIREFIVSSGSQATLAAAHDSPIDGVFFNDPMDNVDESEDDGELSVSSEDASEVTDSSEDDGEFSDSSEDSEPTAPSHQ